MIQACRRDARHLAYNLEAVLPSAMGRQLPGTEGSPFLYMSTVRDVRHESGVRRWWTQALKRADRKRASGSTDLQWWYVSLSGPGAVFSDFRSRRRTSSAEKDAVSTGTGAAGRWNSAEVSAVRGDQVEAQWSWMSGMGMVQDRVGPSMIRRTARRRFLR